MATGGGNSGTPSLRSRLFWFAVLWLGGVLAVGTVAFLIRSVLL